jgi:hypothetical protein
MTFDPKKAELTIFFADPAQALIFRGQNKIKIDISDLDGAVNKYDATLSIYQSSEEAVIDDDALSGKNGRSQGGNLKTQNVTVSNKTLVNPPDNWFAYIEKVSVIG